MLVYALNKLACFSKDFYLCIYNGQFQKLSLVLFLIILSSNAASVFTQFLLRRRRHRRRRRRTVMEKDPLSLTAPSYLTQRLFFSMTFDALMHSFLQIHAIVKGDTCVTLMSGHTCVKLYSCPAALMRGHTHVWSH